MYKKKKEKKKITQKMDEFSPKFVLTLTKVNDIIILKFHFFNYFFAINCSSIF